MIVTTGDWGATAACQIIVVVKSPLRSRMLSQRAKEKAIHDVMCGWKVSAEDPEYEDKGKVSRTRLTGSDQIIAARVAELLTRV